MAQLVQGHSVSQTSALLVGKSLWPKLGEQRTRLPTRDLIGYQLASDKPKRRAAMTEGNVTTWDIFQEPEDGLAVAWYWFRTDTVDIQLKFRIAFQHARRLVEQTLNRCFTDLVAAVGFDDHLLFGPCRIEHQGAGRSSSDSHTRGVEHRFKRQIQRFGLYEQRDRRHIADRRTKLRRHPRNGRPGCQQYQVGIERTAALRDHSIDTTICHARHYLFDIGN